MNKLLHRLSNVGSVIVTLGADGFVGLANWIVVDAVNWFTLQSEITHFAFTFDAKSVKLKPGRIVDPNAVVNMRIVASLVQLQDNELSDS